MLSTYILQNIYNSITMSAFKYCIIDVFVSMATTRFDQSGKFCIMSQKTFIALHFYEIMYQQKTININASDILCYIILYYVILSC